MTGANFYAYVLRKFKRTDKSTEAYEAMTDTVSLMQIKFNSDNYSQESYISGIDTIGEYQIGLPTDFGQIIGTVSVTDTASDDNYANLNKISKQAYDAKYGDRLLTSTGNMNLAVPRDFCIYAGQLYIGPVPDLITYRYQINYTTENATEVASGTATVPFTAELRHRNVLRNGVLFELHDGLENFEEAAYYKQLFLDGLNDIVKQEASNRADGVGVSYSGI